MNPDHYHSVLVALDQALLIFQRTTKEHTADDRQMLQSLELIRSQVLKAESGHPFPLQTVVPAGRAVEPAEEPASSECGAQEGGAVMRDKRIRVLIADDHDSVRSILRAMLAAERDFAVVAEATNGQEAVELAGACRPDIIIMDLNMPVLDGISATRDALRASPDTRVVVFSANREPASMRKAADAGAVGFVCKPASRKELIAVLRDVYCGKTAFQDFGTFSGSRLR